MKTKFFGLVITLCVIISTFFASCNQANTDDPADSTDEVLPEVKDFNIIDSSRTAINVVSLNDSTVVLKYDSRVKFHQILNGKESTPDVTMNIADTLKILINMTLAPVETFDFGFPGGGITTQVPEMLYTIKQVGGEPTLRIQYNFVGIGVVQSNFQVPLALGGFGIPIYRDQQNVVVLPHYEIGVDYMNYSYTVTDLPNTTVNGVVYANKLYQGVFNITVGDYDDGLNMVNKVLDIPVTLNFIVPMRIE